MELQTSSFLYSCKEDHRQGMLSQFSLTRLHLSLLVRVVINLLSSYLIYPCFYSAGHGWCSTISLPRWTVGRFSMHERRRLCVLSGCRCKYACRYASSKLYVLWEKIWWPFDFFLSKIDPYTGNTYKLTTGGVCRETVIGPGIIVPRQTVVS